ncbi:hypothetical protein [Cupriavidus sp. DL-D2]|uniref:hypothetical protein n=1 Tax=Cupriavidus sp. DL-D2 TaxID=3144974 RepID=UPI0032124F9F
MKVTAAQLCLKFDHAQLEEILIEQGFQCSDSESTGDLAAVLAEHMNAEGLSMGDLET